MDSTTNKTVADYLGLAEAGQLDSDGEKRLIAFADEFNAKVVELRKEADKLEKLAVRCRAGALKLAIPVFSPEQVPTVAAAKELHEKHREIYNKSLDLSHHEGQTEAAHFKISKAYNKWDIDLAKYWLKSTETAWRVCVYAITFQHPKSNYTADGAARKSPLKDRIVVDSESGQGFWYCGAEVLEAVFKMLKDMNCKSVVASACAWDYPPMFIW